MSAVAARKIGFSAREASPPYRRSKRIVEDGRIEERIDGVTMMSPRPAIGHSNVAMQLSHQLMPFDERMHGGGGGGSGGWYILYEPELYLGGNAIVPDLAGWRSERVPVLPNVARIKIAPDWVCEILSKSTQRYDRFIKMPAYARAGVPFIWLIDDRQRSVEVYVLDAATGSYKLSKTASGSRRARLAPFAARFIDLSPLWL